MAENTNARLDEAAIKHAVYLTRLESGVASRMMKLIAKVDADIVRRIAAAPEAPSAARLNRMLDRLREMNAELRRQLKDGLRGELGALAAYEADFAKRAFETIVGMEFDGVSPATVRSAAMSQPFQGPHLRWATVPEHIDEWHRRRIRMVDSEIRLSFVEGETTFQTARRVRDVLGVNRRTAETIARTATTHIATRAREQFYIENDDIVDKVRFLAILDSRTCPICAALDGQTWPVGAKDTKRPPRHANCRCTLQAVLDEAEFGLMPEATTWDKWLRNQPAAFQDEVLGTTRGRLFRASPGLKLGKFVDRRGGLYTLDELRAKDAELFERAGIAA